MSGGAGLLVFDDLVVGFDRRRRSATGNALLEVTERGAQVIVLTHQPEFADELLAAGFSQSLCIRRDGERSVIDAYPGRADSAADR